MWQDKCQMWLKHAFLNLAAVNFTYSAASVAQARGPARPAAQVPVMRAVHCHDL
eukprot:SAG11_NODE_33256_length_278_cov_0.860335_1_plen_53_part_10